MKKTALMRKIEKETGEDIMTILASRYVECEVSSHGIAAEFSVSHKTIINWLRKLNIRVRRVDDPKMSAVQKLEFCPVQLKKFMLECDEGGLTDSAVGRMLGTDAMTVRWIRQDLEKIKAKPSAAGTSVNSLLFIIY